MSFGVCLAQRGLQLLSGVWWISLSARWPWVGFKITWCWAAASALLAGSRWSPAGPDPARLPRGRRVVGPGLGTSNRLRVTCWKARRKKRGVPRASWADFKPVWPRGIYLYLIGQSGHQSVTIGFTLCAKPTQAVIKYQRTTVHPQLHPQHPAERAEGIVCQGRALRVFWMGEPKSITFDNWGLGTQIFPPLYTT